MGSGLAAISWRLARERVEFSLVCSTLARARRRLSSTERPRIKQPRMVAAAIE